MESEYDYLRNIDKVLPSMLDSSGFAESPTIPHINLDPHLIAVDQLIADGLMIEDPRQRGVFRLTGEGRAFIRRGGYKAKFEEEERIKKLSENQVQSVIQTNKIQRNTSIISTIVAFAAVIVASMTLCNNDKERDILIQKELQQLRQSIDSMANYQRVFFDRFHP
ncbi:MAG: hypothetical protein JNL51_05095 [Chitinophagaceae bacterium]|nr:hypothetical protein [Chitinophagaceae bacterium]